MISLTDSGVGKGAILSDCQTYRHALQRYVKSPTGSIRWVAWILNNPSTADSEIDDATTRRTWAFTQSWGYNGMMILNTNPYRSTNPGAQKIPPLLVLAYNDGCLIESMSLCELTVCGWGDSALPELARHTALLLQSYGPLHALRVSKAKNPAHPLYLPGNLTPQPWAPTKWLQ